MLFCQCWIKFASLSTAPLCLAETSDWVYMLEDDEIENIGDKLAFFIASPGLCRKKRNAPLLPTK